jgi:hypothetical protein
MGPVSVVATVGRSSRRVSGNAPIAVFSVADCSDSFWYLLLKRCIPRNYDEHAARNILALALHWLKAQRRADGNRHTWAGAKRFWAEDLLYRLSERRGRQTHWMREEPPASCLPVRKS